jgi:hypothetical protein
MITTTCRIFWMPCAAAPPDADGVADVADVADVDDDPVHAPAASSAPAAVSASAVRTVRNLITTPSLVARSGGHINPGLTIC